MSQVLIINAHPLTSKESSTLKLLEKFEAVYTAAHPEDVVEKVNLYSSDLPEIDGDILSGWNKLKAGTSFDQLAPIEQDKITRFNKYTEQFLAADKIVVANALWNLNIPTRLKAWIDTINVAGKSFKYTATGPVPLTEGKKALHIQSNGGVYHGQEPASRFLKDIFNFVGVADFNEAFVEGIDYDPANAESILGTALSNVESIAASF